MPLCSLVHSHRSRVSSINLRSRRPITAKIGELARSETGTLLHRLGNVACTIGHGKRTAALFEAYTANYRREPRGA